MGKKKASKTQQNKIAQTDPQPVLKMEGRASPRTAYMKLALVVICLLLYGNTLNNEYCLDDAIVITKNSVTQKGFAGIPDHLTHDYVYGFFNRPFNSAFSPWRPLSLVSFSIEVGLFGMENPWISHLINVLLYTITVVLIFNFFSKYLFKDIWLSFLAAFLFAIHPIHTEVVANIKSRDEILALLFLVLALISLWKHLEGGQNRNLVFSSIYFFLSLLSKENALTFVVGIPITLYFFSSLNRAKIFRYGFMFLGVALFFMILRLTVVPINPGAEEKVHILSHPYAYATASEAFFTKVYILLRYLKLLFIPYPLVYDYSYNAIPFVGPGNPLVWISALVHLGLLVYGLANFRKKSMVAYCIIMYLVSFSISSNIILPIAVFIGERLLYTPSLFFCILLAYWIKKLISYLSENRKLSPALATTFIMLPLLASASIIVINRNVDWKNNNNLNLSAIKHVPESYKANDGVAFYYMQKAKDGSLTKTEKDSLNRKAIQYYEKALSLVPDMQVGLINVGLCYYLIGDVPKAEQHWMKLKEVNPGYPEMKKMNDDLAHYYIYKGIDQLGRKVYDSAEISLVKGRDYAAQNDSLSFLAWYNSALMYNQTNRIPQAVDALEKVLRIRPEFEPAKQGLFSLTGRERVRED